jgi:hypothetical protein
VVTFPCAFQRQSLDISGGGRESAHAMQIFQACGDLWQEMDGALYCSINQPRNSCSSSSKEFLSPPRSSIISQKWTAQQLQPFFSHVSLAA